MTAVLTPQAEDFSRWYQDVVAKAELAENGPARGTMILRPWGYGIWERLQAELDLRIKATGHSNVAFPSLIPISYFRKEAEHVEGFAPELAVVTQAGGSELAEPLVVRPTSETVIGEAMSRWIRSHRDLPLLLNQWANVVRWEMRPRLLLRTSEFLWQEGHTAHATDGEAHEEVLRILREVYLPVIDQVLGMPVIVGRKTNAQRFAGARVTYALEALMRDGKALQAGTVHDLGTNFARAFEISYLGANGAQELVRTTSWGVSTRLVGGVVMTHGDDDGLRLPPAVAPAQVVVIAVRDESIEACAKLVQGLAAAGVRALLDDRTDRSFGRRAVDVRLKGAPLRIELGPRDVTAGTAVVVRRDTEAKESIRIDALAARVPALLEEISRSLRAQALERREALTQEVKAEAQIDGPGFFVIPWDDLGREAGEQRIAERGYSVRCLVDGHGEIPAGDVQDGLIAWVAKAY